MSRTDEVLMLRGIDPVGSRRRAGKIQPYRRQLGAFGDESDGYAWGYEYLPEDFPEDCGPHNDYCGALGPGDEGGGAEPPPGFVGPGAVPVVVEAWDVDSDPARYQLQYGDTLAGLAATYLGDGTRWKEIWAVQDPNFRATRSPDKLYASEWINMPDEARDNFLAWIDKGEPPGKTPGGLAKQKKADKLRGKGEWKKFALFGGLAAAAVGTVWWLSS